ncbi:carbohydrate ABC transporter permease [Thalassobacillus pellis]|uniref:carbohydrate ABC transporter permease n=1 Tax=Thalassobacillus pellis TaxID=748008 RepID=UPI0019620A4A|nr:carbohydrate ABC transporter permease [Thalassobacillus pellis]MBM7554449.1 raffinose/stachyose/melibiose transport system permease protein [Thalassobacillus pellis]
MKKKEFPRQLILLFYTAVILIPLSMVFLATFKTTSQLFKDPLGLPESFSLDNYYELFVKEAMLQYFLNSIIVTAITVFCVILLATLISYSIIRISGKMGILLFGFFVAGMMVPTQVNMIPIYLLVTKLGMIDTLRGVILVSIGFLIPIAVFILTGFMKTLSKSLFEAAKMDGANEWQIYSKIVLPLSLPAIATVTIFSLVIVWNDLLYPLLLLKSDSVKTLPIALLEFQGQYLTNYPLIFSGVIIASLPMTIAYIFLQRYFIAGMTAGSVKG